jgi:hypothetical protein
MFLHDPQDDFRSAEIITENADAASQGSRASFRTSEIVAQNTAASADASKMPRLILMGVGLFLVYHFLMKGMR